jgi:hypothetical protein
MIIIIILHTHIYINIYNIYRPYRLQSTKNDTRSRVQNVAHTKVGISQNADWVFTRQRAPGISGSRQCLAEQTRADKLNSQKRQRHIIGLNTMPTAWSMNGAQRHYAPPAEWPCKPQSVQLLRKKRYKCTSRANGGSYDRNATTNWYENRKALLIFDQSWNVEPVNAATDDQV